MRTFQYLIAATLAYVLVSCNNQTQEATSTFDLEKIKMRIKEVNQKFMAAIDDGDSMKVASLYHSNAIVMPDNAELVSGNDQILAFAGMMDNINLKLETKDVWGNEEVVVEEGFYEITDKGGNSLDNGKYIVLWKEEGGQWKLYRDIWCSSVPMAMPEPSNDADTE